MTAEIAILNKTAVALAADSAVTIRSRRGRKVFNTVNKVFALSKYHPVGIMVFGRANFYATPWETIIKLFRKELKKKNYQTVFDYTDAFLEFLGKNIPLFFPASVQKRYLFKLAFAYFDSLKRKFQHDFEATPVWPLSKDDLKEKAAKLMAEIIGNALGELEKADFLPGFGDDDVAAIPSQNSDLLDKAVATVFQNLPISDQSRENLKRIAALIVTKDHFPDDTSGMVFAGFGEGDVFPKLASITVDGAVNDKVIFKKDQEVSIDFDQAGIIIPFAQKQTARTFIEGIDPVHLAFIEDTFEKFSSTLFGNLIQAVGSQELSAETIKKIESIKTKTIEAFFQAYAKYRQKKNIDPIASAVEVLPKEEIAAMAESLVSIASFKQRITRDDETVGGPIDGAVISKGDGFVWIKRKHYFDPKLNAAFFNNYFREDDL